MWFNRTKGFDFITPDDKTNDPRSIRWLSDHGEGRGHEYQIAVDEDGKPRFRFGEPRPVSSHYGGSAWFVAYESCKLEAVMLDLECSRWRGQNLT
ncbi:hypothetical protein M0R45_007070 [Rubus argutus]|uniref:Uncharacterized protein n=1 Tax=Rubus argutus TaxID=59490 RepID=A0AAW1YSC0_RUBAR